MRKLLLLVLLLLLLPAPARAQAITWPSLSPSYRCDDDVAIFTLTNVGTDMQAGAQWYTATPRRIVEQGVVWLHAGGSNTWAYRAPGIELTFAYVRPDTGEWVRITQTCGARPQPTPTPTVPVEGAVEHWSYLPWVPVVKSILTPGG